MMALAQNFEEVYRYSVGSVEQRVARAYREYLDAISGRPPVFIKGSGPVLIAILRRNPDRERILVNKIIIKEISEELKKPECNVRSELSAFYAMGLFERRSRGVYSLDHGVLSFEDFHEALRNNYSCVIKYEITPHLRKKVSVAFSKCDPCVRHEYINVHIDQIPKNQS